MPLYGSFTVTPGLSPFGRIYNPQKDVSFGLVRFSHSNSIQFDLPRVDFHCMSNPSHARRDLTSIKEKNLILLTSEYHPMSQVTVSVALLPGTC